MIAYQKPREVLTAAVGADAVAKLVEKFDEDAIDAVFALMAENRNLSLPEAVEHTMDYYCGAWEELSEYLATNLQSKIDEALEEYSRNHDFNWQIKVSDLTQMNWGDIADYAEDNYYYTIRTKFDDLDRMYFIFAVPSNNY